MNNNQRVSQSMERRIILVFIVSALAGILLVGGSLWFFLQRAALAQCRTNLEGRARVLASQCESEITEARRDLEFLSKTPSFQQLPYVDRIDAAINGIPENVDIEKRQFLTRLLNKTERFSVIYICTPNGDLYIVEPFRLQPKLTRHNLSDRPYFQEAVRTKAPVVSDSFLGADGVVAVAILAPIFDDAGEVTGYLGGVSYLSRLSQMVSKEQIRPFDAGFIVDRKGQLIAHTDTAMLREGVRERFIEQRPLLSRFLASADSTVGSERLAIQGDEIVDPVNAKRYLTALVPLNSGWVLGLMRDRAAVLAEARPVIWGITSLAGMLLALIGGLGVAFAHGIGRRWDIAECALRASEQRFRIATETGNDLTYEWDLKQNVQWFGKIDEMLGYAPGEFPRTLDGWAASLHPEDLERVTAAIQAHLKEKAPYDVEYRVRSKDGDYRWWAARGATARTAVGTPVRWVGTVTDVTERKLAEETLRETNEYLDNLIGYANAPIIVWDPQFRITRFNHAFETLTGRKAEDVLRQSLEILFPLDQVETSMELIRKTMSGERWEDVEINILHVRGSIRIVLWNSATIFATDGVTPVATIAQGLDITERKRAEDALRESEARFRMMFENVKDYAIITLDSEGLVMSWNAGAERIKGYRADEIVGQHFSCFYPREDIECGKPERELAVAVAEGRFEDEGWRVRKDGSRFIANVVLTAMRDDADRLRGFVKVTRDITERKRAEEALRESELKYRTVANNTYDWEHWKRPDGSFYYLSPSCERISGYSPDDFLAEPGLMKRIIIPEDAGIFEAHTRHDVEQMKVGETEFRIRAKDGSTRWISHNCLPVFDDAGVYIGTRGTNRDITGRKRMAEALAIQARIATIFLTVPDDEIFNGVLKEILDIMQSPIGVFGYIDEAGALVVPTMTWQIWDKCRVPEKTVRFPREEWGCSSWPRAIREKRAIHCNEPSINIPEGHVGIQRHISLPIQSRGEVIGLFQVANKESDYTEADIRTLEEIARHVASILNAQLDRLRAEERLKLTVANLERSNKELEQFAYIASHDLQEPLRMVASYTQLLAQRYEGQLDDKAKKYIDYAVDGAGRMQRLINDLLDYSRVNRFGKPPETVDSHSSLGEALRNLSAAIEENRAIVINEDLPLVRADATQLCQLFQNLISNAIKFRGAESPRIQVSASDLGREWRFSVKDNGIGIDAQYADKVFVIFQRLHTRQEYSGTGIGLAICNRIVERHGGRIWFDSEPGKGSTFYFTLPK